MTIVPNDGLSPDIRRNLAAGIFVSANERFEELQLEFGNNWSAVPNVQANAIASYYSEEDLPSDLIGFYVGYQRNLTNGQLPSQEFYDQVRVLCKGVGRDAVGKEKSKQVFNQTYANGVNLVTQWRNWRGRNIPLIGCDSKLCQETRTWPQEFSSLLYQSIAPSINGTWWWNKDTYGNTVFGIRETFRPGLYLIPYPVPFPY